MNSIQTLKTSLTYAVARVRVRGPLARIEREVNEHRFAAVHHRRANHRYQQLHWPTRHLGPGTRASGPY